MGSAASTPDKATEEPHAQEGNHTFIATPQDKQIAAKSPEVLFEVTTEGFRLLRPTTKDPFTLFNWGNIHSWAHTPATFTFKFYDERTCALASYSFKVDNLEGLLRSIDTVVGQIMSRRKAQALSDMEFSMLRLQLEGMPEELRLEKIRTAAQFNYFSSTQGLTMLHMLSGSFDRVEAACALHAKLVDQNNFGSVLTALECEADRDNVWHRLQALKRQQSLLTNRASSKRLSP